MRAWAAWLVDRINARALRERILMLITALVLLAALAEFAIFQGMRADLERMATRSGELRTNIADSREQIQALTDKLSQDPNAAVEARIDELRERIRRVEGRLQARRQELVGPAEMVAVLRDLVKQQEGVDLVSMESQPPKVIEELGDKADEDGGELPARVYRHGLRMELQGGFGDALAYLRAVEGFEWRLFWDRMDIEVTEYPEMRIRLRLHTVSLDEDWIGV